MSVKIENSVLYRFMFCFDPLNSNNELKNYIYLRPHPIKQQTHHILLCRNCGKEYIAYMKSFIGKDKTRCRCGARKKYEETMLKKYGDINYNNQKKFKKTMIKRYGTVTFNNQKKMKQTNLERYGNTSYLKTEEGRNRHIKRMGLFTTDKKKTIVSKIKNTLNKKYNVNNPYEVPGAKENGIKTIIEKYGSYKKYLKTITEKTRRTRVSKGDWVDIEKTVGFQKYKRLVQMLTNKNKRKLYETWDGYDYYDGEFIKPNMTLKTNKGLKPSIDHKTSRMFGYLNGIDPKIISRMDNLCITKHKINAKKRHRTESQFVEYLKNHPV